MSKEIYDDLEGEVSASEVILELQSRIEELESENKLFRSTESVSDSVWDGLLAEIRGMQSRIEAGLKLADEMAKKSGDCVGGWNASYRMGYQDAAKQLRKALGGKHD
jgi:FtsZ-binding cell division protein ZapB